MNIKSLTIFCSSSDHLKSEYYELAEKLGDYLAKRSIKIIYGGGRVGLMGKISQSAYKSGGKVIGIIPKFLATKEKINNETTKTIIVKNMVDRKKKLFEMGEGFLILPGGSGTIEEATEIISWKFLGLHNKEIIFFNLNNFWNPLFQMYAKIENKKFGYRNLQSISKNICTIQQFKKII